ncbi:MAG: hypothetical protein QOI58_2042 [Thermoanaerobaculia bacterium]|nr:hypothetical protein [Thermoanaerobaculia bacterium]
MDKKNLLGGQDWRIAIRKALRESSHFIALLSSNSVSKRGFVQKEIREAIAVLEEIPPDEIFAIVLRLEEVEPTYEALKNLHWIELFLSYEEGFRELQKSLTNAPVATSIRTVPPYISHLDSVKNSPARWIAGIAIACAAVLALVVNLQPRWMDQKNCGPGEHWVGMTPSAMERTFQVTAEQAKHAVLRGELRWSPEINQHKQTTIGEIDLEVDGRQNAIYKWNSPATSTYPFDVKISHLLVGTSGHFKIRWKWENGTSGVCVVRNELVFPPT